MLREAKGVVSLGSHHRLDGRNVSLFDNQNFRGPPLLYVKYAVSLYVKYVKYAVFVYVMYVKYVELFVL